VTLPKKQVRMCINCRDRFSQKELLRIQNIDMKIVKFSGKGRSFYLCKECLDLDEKKLIKALFRQCKSNKIEFNKQDLENCFKEKIVNVRKD